MNTPAKLTGFVTAVAAVFGIALLVGAAVGPVEEQTEDPTASAHDAGHGNGTVTGSAAETPAVEEIPGGLMTYRNGYALALAETDLESGEDRNLTFAINGPGGAPVTDFDVTHDKELHLIAVRRDFTGFQHVHPVLDENTGIWSVDVDLTPGTWRVFTDFTPTGGEPLTLGTDLAVAGEFVPAAPQADNRTATVDDYEVTLDGDLSSGSDAMLTLTVSKDGRPLTDLQPYLGAYGHLVALRGGDLAYLHVHPDGTPGDGTTRPGPEVVFHTSVPSAGTYHLYLDFQHDGVVRTAAFTLTAGGTGEVQPGSGAHGDPSHSGR
ncbi:hypothetical protein A5767_16110 [Rhodococcus sp. 852002-51564_SCH6189132-a]|uniref:hypothetical protein n=1 Tax=Rhodococcus TaxID=1827 RepID=UPI0007EA6FAD|nr:hypothetical protein [Rhodococcus sp. 852002-51564_SCH6189132-a]OBA32747.1 hypothetical protein A5767_16110 [Rhodococcus sp. 852002-51564_SCH6189132-a]